MLRISLFVVVLANIAQAKEAQELTKQAYKEAINCLNTINASNPYVWQSGSSPYAYESKTRDHFVVLGRDGAFVRFGDNVHEKCDFQMIHNSTRDCVKIMDTDGNEIVTMKYNYKDAAKQACNTNNPNSTTKYKYNSNNPCTELPYSEMGKILQKQIAVNTEKLIVEKHLSRNDFDKQFRKSCESIYNKLWDGVGSDFGATVNQAFKKVKQQAAQSDNPEKGSNQGNGGNENGDTVIK